MEEQELNRVLQTFSCEKDKDIELFLKKRAVNFEKMAKARTYLIFDEERLAEHDYTVLAYISLAIKSFPIPPKLSNRKRKELDGFSGKIDGVPITHVPCYLLGQLAKNSNVKENMKGSELLEIAYSFVRVAANVVGGRWMLIECRNTAVLTTFYKNNNFHFVDNETSGNETLVQMIRKIEA